MNTGRFNLIDIALFGKALVLARGAQRVRSAPVTEVVDRMARRGGCSPEWPVERLSRAADRGTDRWARWSGGLDTCLMRSLVLGSMLSRRANVVLNIGFSEGSDPTPELAGHAWVTVGGRPVGRDGRRAETRYTRVLEVPFRKSVPGP